MKTQATKTLNITIVEALSRRGKAALEACLSLCTLGLGLLATAYQPLRT
jgi:hypothetical protein